MTKVIVIGAGIGGLTAAALLARRGYEVIAYDGAIVPGGCASTFQRKGFTFDVGATQVAGLEEGGIHQRIFAELGMDLPVSTYCDPACAVILPGEKEPINIWRDRDEWQRECRRQFPGSDRFWQLLNTLFQASWEFQSRDPVLPPRNWWDLQRLIGALRLDTAVTFPFALSTVADALKWCGVGDDRRLRQFLDLQLKLYSQVDASETALLYAATALGVSQSPLGLYHLQGSMQVLSDRLAASLARDGGKLLMRHQVTGIETNGGRVTGVKVMDLRRKTEWVESADAIIANVTVQNLVELIGEPTEMPLWRQWWYGGYRDRIHRLPPASGAFVVYLGVSRAAIAADCPPHLQFMYDGNAMIGENNSLFVSVSKEGDGRAPQGTATLIASSFTDTDRWWGEGVDYEALKAEYTAGAIERLGSYFDLRPENILHVEAATPRTFAHYTGRERGFVGGVGQRIGTFGPFGVANRTPIDRLWLVGDCTHPGEGTAGTSYSALTAVRQLVAELS